jgi:hypothetical protein
MREPLRLAVDSCGYECICVVKSWDQDQRQAYTKPPTHAILAEAMARAVGMGRGVEVLREGPFYI